MSHVVKFAPASRLLTPRLRSPRGAASSDVAAGPMLAHDYLLVLRGAERTFAAMAACWPDAPIYTLLYDEQGTARRVRRPRVATSPLQRLGAAPERFRRLLPLFPRARRRLPSASGASSVSSSQRLRARRPAAGDVPHVCYCHSPFRYAWHERDLALAEVPRAAAPRHARAAWPASAAGTSPPAAASPTTSRTRAITQRADRRVLRPRVGDHPPARRRRPLLARRARGLLPGRHRGRRATSASRSPSRPPAAPAADQGRRHRPRPRAPPAAVRAAAPTFLGRIDDAELADVYADARALVVPNVEEFGIAAVEAQAAGRPVLAADAGGARETVIEGVTGHRLPVDDIDALAEAMAHIDFDPLRPARHPRERDALLLRGVPREARGRGRPRRRRGLAADAVPSAALTLDEPFLRVSAHDDHAQGTARVRRRRGGRARHRLTRARPRRRERRHHRVLVCQGHGG